MIEILGRAKLSNFATSISPSTWSREPKDLPNTSCVNGISTSLYLTHPLLRPLLRQQPSRASAPFSWPDSYRRLDELQLGASQILGDKAWDYHRLRLRVRSVTGDPPWVTKNPSRRLPQVEIGDVNGGIKNQIHACHGSWNRGDFMIAKRTFRVPKRLHACAFMTIFVRT